MGNVMQTMSLGTFVVSNVDTYIQTDVLNFYG